jgi:hypothetical protein
MNQSSKAQNDEASIKPSSAPTKRIRWFHIAAAVLLLAILVATCAIWISTLRSNHLLEQLPEDARASLDQRVELFSMKKSYTVSAVQKSEFGEYWCIAFSPPLNGANGHDRTGKYGFIEPNGNAFILDTAKDEKKDAISAVLDIYGCGTLLK